MAHNPLQIGLLSGGRHESSKESPHHRVEVVEERADFHSNRFRALREPERALETLQPYGRLYIGVRSAAGLRSFDFFGKSDPFVEIYINDQLLETSHVVPMTLNPHWDFHSAPLGIWSPRSVVLIKIMDYDLGSKNDLLGFVEFYVGDLDPNSELSGKFVIQDRSKLWGTAHDRLRRESTFEFTRMTEEGTVHDVETLQSKLDALLEQRRAKKAESTSTECLESAEEPPQEDKKWETPKDLGNQEAGSSRSNRRGCGRFSFCSGKPPKESDDQEASKEPESVTESDPVPPSCSPVDKAATSLSSGSLQMSIKFTAACAPGDEWSAFCFPRPIPKAYLVPMDALPVLDLGQIYHDLTGITNLLWQKLLRWLWLLCLYLISWKSKPLSAAVLCWWWSVCIQPVLLLPSLPLAVASFVFVLLDESWSKAILIDEDNAPLDDDGFRIVASFGNHKRMRRWLRRLINHGLSSKVTDEKALDHYAFFVMGSGSLAYTVNSLLESLREKPWVERAHAEDLKGLVHKQMHGFDWHLPGILVPDVVEQAIRESQVPLHDAHRELATIFALAEDFLRDKKFLQSFYKGCLVASLLLLLLELLHSLSHSLLHMIISVTLRGCLFVAGTVIMTFSAWYGHMLRTYMRATSDQRFFLERRALGGVRNWPFFTPGEEHSRWMI